MSKARLTVVSEICSTDLLIYFFKCMSKKDKIFKKKPKHVVVHNPSRGSCITTDEHQLQPLFCMLAEQLQTKRLHTCCFIVTLPGVPCDNTWYNNLGSPVRHNHYTALILQTSFAEHDVVFSGRY